MPESKSKTKPKPAPKVDGFVVLTDACTVGATGDWLPASELEHVNTAALVRAGHLEPRQRTAPKTTED